MRKQRLLIVALIAAALWPAAWAKAGVYAHYNFDADYTDDSGNARHGSLVDTGTLGNSGVTTAAGQYVFGGGALNLSTDRDYIDLTSTIFADGSAWTIAFWAKKAPTTTDDSASWDMVIGQRNNTNHFIALNGDTDYIRWRGSSSSSARQLDASYPGGLDDEQWHHYVVTASAGGTVTAYIDGSAANSGTKSAAFIYDTLGAAYTGGLDFFGQIDEVWVFNEALTAPAVATLGVNNLAPVTLIAADGASSFTNGGNWSDGAAPSADKDYFTSNYTIRTPGGSATFAGHSLSVDTGGRFIMTNGVGAITVNDLRLNGGTVYNGLSGTNFTLAGNITANASTTSTFDSQASGRTITVVAPISGSGNIVKAANGDLVFTAVNTYTGNTTVNAGSLSLTSTNEQRFLIQDANLSNTINGSGTINLDGLFRLDTSLLNDLTGVWNLVAVDTLNESWGSNFGLAFLSSPAFMDLGGGVYTLGKWTFDQATGNLTLVPVPAALPAGLGLLAMAGLRRRGA